MDLPFRKGEVFPVFVSVPQTGWVISTGDKTTRVRTEERGEESRLHQDMSEVGVGGTEVHNGRRSGPGETGADGEDTPLPY